jgi:hypothetical protein
MQYILTRIALEIKGRVLSNYTITEVVHPGKIFLSFARGFSSGMR